MSTIAQASPRRWHHHVVAETGERAIEQIAVDRVIVNDEDAIEV